MTSVPLSHALLGDVTSGNTAIEKAWLPCE